MIHYGKAFLLLVLVGLSCCVLLLIVSGRNSAIAGDPAFSARGEAPGVSGKADQALSEKKVFIFHEMFDDSVENPAYVKNKGPVVLFDEGHFNVHTSDGNYKKFVSLIRNDGYRVTVNTSKFSRETLHPYDILVISNALEERNFKSQASEIFSAFLPGEIEAVHEWVKRGGAMLLIADHDPWGEAAYQLAEKFGVTFSKGRVFDPTGIIVFSRETHRIIDHPITRGRDASERVNKVITFLGQSFEAPPGSGFLILSEDAYDIHPQTKEKRAVPGQFQGAAFPYGQGRVVVMGEAAIFRGRRGTVTEEGKAVFRSKVPEHDESVFKTHDNKQIILNIMHYLSGLLYEENLHTE